MKHNWGTDRKAVSAWLCALLVLMLAGCASISVLPQQTQTPARLQTYKLTLVSDAGQTEDSLLVVQPESDGAARWIQTNALGAPLARLQLRDGTWTTDGFLPPNPAARQLFEAIIASEIPRQQWPSAYPDVVITTTNSGSDTNYTFSRGGRMLWSLQLPGQAGTEPAVSTGESSPAQPPIHGAPPASAPASAPATHAPDTHASDTRDSVKQAPVNQPPVSPAPVTRIVLPDHRHWHLTPLPTSS